jgi:hypothetical protein
MNPVKMSLDGFDPAKVDDACYFVETFARKAKEQGWQQEDIDRVCQGFPASRAFSALRPWIEETAPDYLPWRFQIDRLKDYTEGCAYLADDPEVSYRPFRWYASGLKTALKMREINERVHEQKKAQEREPEQKEEREDLKPTHGRSRGM